MGMGKTNKLSKKLEKKLREQAFADKTNTLISNDLRKEIVRFIREILTTGTPAQRDLAAALLKKVDKPVRISEGATHWSG
jgi:hypothetical protein